MTRHRSAPHFAPETRIPLRATLQTSATGSWAFYTDDKVNPKIFPAGIIRNLSDPPLEAKLGLAGRKRRVLI